MDDLIIITRTRWQLKRAAASAIEHTDIKLHRLWEQAHILPAKKQEAARQRAVDYVTHALNVLSLCSALLPSRSNITIVLLSVAGASPVALSSTVALSPELTIAAAAPPNHQPTDIAPAPVADQTTLLLS